LGPGALLPRRHDRPLVRADNDTLAGGAGSDILYGGDGADVIAGNGGAADRAYEISLSDQLFGITSYTFRNADDASIIP
jgi:Ca2+-binding RTX toxin-like protein